MKQIFPILFFLILAFQFLNCGNNETHSQPASGKQKTIARPDSIKANPKPKVTFVELGSVNCVPCRMMQPVMKAIDEEFGDQVEVVFYDVWKNAAPGRKYGIKLIPTQVFLDEAGNEFFRHEGYFPKEKIEDLLMQKGLTILKHVDVEN